LDAEQVVLQMLLSQPQDLRLLWLYGELLNARGQIAGAYEVLNFVRSLNGSRELRQHCSVLDYARPSVKALERPETQELLLWWLAPRGLPVPAGVGGALNELAWPAADFAHPLKPRAPVAAPTTSASAPASAPIGQLPEWRTLLVGFGVGVVATILAGYQWNEWRRRRRAAWSPSGNGRPYTASGTDQSEVTSVKQQPRD
jgi:hypothetical protein